MNTSVKTSEKAQRLSAAGAVTWRHDHIYFVVGDHDTYSVAVYDPQRVEGFCSCPADRVCSHLIAACAYERVHPVTSLGYQGDPFAGLNE